MRIAVAVRADEGGIYTRYVCLRRALELYGHDVVGVCTGREEHRREA